MLDIFTNVFIAAALLAPATIINEPFQNDFEVAEIDKMIFENQLDHISIYGEITIQKNKEGLNKARLIRQNLTNIVKELERQTTPITILQPNSKRKP